MGGSASKKKKTEKNNGEKEKHNPPPAASAASVSDAAPYASAVKETAAAPDTSAANEIENSPDASAEKETETAPYTPAAEKIGSLDTDTIWVKIQDQAEENKVMELSPFDRNAAGRAVPMLWYYQDTLDQDALLSSLRKALCVYPGGWRTFRCYFCVRRISPRTFACSIIA